jgi:transposase InsO family protein
VLIHGNARLLPRQRALMCERVRHEGWTVNDAAEAFGVSPRTVFRWLCRYDAGDPMTDRSSAPGSVPGRTPAQTEALIEQLRRLRWTSTRIAGELGMATSTVCAVLKRQGLNRLSRLEPPEPPNRYCRRHPGELIHIDIKKLGRFDRPGLPAHLRQAGYRRNGASKHGWDYCHVAVDDTSRLAYVEILDDEKGATCVGFLRRAIDWFADHGITVERVMTDNGSCYLSKAFDRACRQLGIKHIKIKPYTPQTNGKAERFIQTALREWAYATAFEHSDQRRQALLPWLHRYNWHRPHASLAKKPPISRLGLTGNNLLSLHS